MREVASHGGAAFLLRGSGAAIGFLINLLLVWYVGMAGFGLYCMAMATKNVAVAVGKQGYERVLVRTVAANVAIDSIQGVHGAWNFASRKVLRASLLAALMLALLAWPLAHFVFDDPPLTSVLVLIALAVLPAAMAQLGCAALRGLKRTVASQFIDSVSGPLVACALLPVMATYWGVEGTIIGHGLALVVAAALALMVWQRVAPKLGEQRPECDTEALARASRPLMHTDLMNLLMTTMPTLLLFAFWDKVETGVFGLVLRTAMLIAFIQMGLTAILGPKFAAMWKLQQLDQLRDLARRSSWLAMAAALPVALLFCLAPEFVLSMFSQRAAEGSMALVVITVSQLVNVISGPVGSLLVMSGHERAVRNATVLAIVLQLGLCMWLIPPHGALGAAIATAATVTVKNLINVGLARQLLGVRLLGISRPRKG